MADVVIGAGAIGLHIAYYLQKQGRQVIILDKTAADDNCSFGNAGYLSPSHFIPLATRDLLWQGVKWMMDSTSPFYIKPRLDIDLMKWGYLFWKHASRETVIKNTPHLFQLLRLSRDLTAGIHRDLEGEFDLWLNGCLMLYLHEKTGKHEKELALQAEQEYNMKVPVLNIDELQEIDPKISNRVLGGALYTLDGHVHPGKMMNALKKQLLKNGAIWITEQEVIGFETKGRSISRIIGKKESYIPENVILAAGSWTSRIVKSLGISLPLQPGKGYSYTYENVKENISLPAILVDHRVAMTPLGQDLRVGGTMEMGGLDRSISPQRIPPIINAANTYYNDINLPYPDTNKVWSGLRPVSPDGLPYIGNSKPYQNLYVATGHAMLGISSAAATGYLLSQIIMGQNTDIPMEAFRVHRFEE